MGPKGEKISKRSSSYKSPPKLFKLNILNFPPNGSPKTTFEIFELLICNDFNFAIVEWKNQKPQLSGKTSDRRAKLNEIWDSWVKHI